MIFGRWLFLICSFVYEDQVVDITYTSIDFIVY